MKEQSKRAIVYICVTTVENATQIYPYIWGRAASNTVLPNTNLHTPVDIKY
jgi:hypothetical protein